MKGVYVIPYSCGTPYIGEISCTINQRINEHPTDLKHGRTQSFSLVEHSKRTKHHACIEQACVIARVAQFHHRKSNEDIKIEKRPTNLNRDDGWKISNCWILALSS